MKDLKKKIVAVTAIILMMASALALCAQSVNADETSASYMFVSAPSEVGVNQDFTVVFWMSSVTPDAWIGGGSRWTGITVTITKPDNTTETRGPFTMDAVASSFFTYTPTEIGDYKFQASFPGQTIPPYFSFFGGMVAYNTTFLPCKSPVWTVSVTETPAPAPHDVPLPTEYWARPINGQNANWWQISSNWLMPGWDTMSRQFDQGSVYDPYATTPSSPHVIWTKPLTFGGLAGGEFGGTSFHNGMSYEQFFKPPVIISGRLYYNTIVGNEPTTYMNDSSITCVDMETGETLFTIPNARLAFGQIYNYISPNQGGTLAYLWDTASVSGTWRMFDAWTGQYMLSFSGVPSGTTLLDNTWGGPGDILVYSLDSVTGTLSLWNSSRVLIPGNPGFNYWTWRPELFYGQTLNATGITTMNIPGYSSTWDTNGTMWKIKLANFPAGASIAQIGHDNKIWVMSGSGRTADMFSAAMYQTWASYDMKTGNLLSGPTTINLLSKLPANASANYGFSNPLFISDDGILPVFVKQTLQYYAWNIVTGNFLWGPTTAYANGWAMYNWESQFVANGIVYNWGFDGMIHAFNVTTGVELWTFGTGNAGSMTPYGTWPLYNGLTVTADTIIAQTGDHGNGAQPLYQGEGIYVMNAATGTPIWNLTGWFCQPVLADGKMMSQNLYDNQIYCFGKGKTETTITAPMVAVTEGTLGLLQGSVIDQSPGAKGAAAVSEADMKAWMEYLYEQQPLSGHIVTGVPVSIDAVDPNMNFIHIGDATSDGTGQYSYTWQIPLVPGTYTIIATFAGSNSYWSSHAETHMIVSSVPQVTPLPEYPQPFDYTMHFVYAVIAIIVAIAIVGVLILRKK